MVVYLTSLLAFSRDSLAGVNVQSVFTANVFNGQRAIQQRYDSNKLIAQSLDRSMRVHTLNG